MRHSKMQNHSDEALYGLYKDGNQLAFTILCRRHVAAIDNYLSKSLAVRHLRVVDDLIQTTLIALSQTAPVFEDGCARKWLLKVAKLDAVDYIRHETRQKRNPGMPVVRVTEDDSFTDSFTDSLIFNELAEIESSEILLTLIDRLPDAEWKVIQLFLAGETKRAIEKLLDMSQQSVITHYRRAVSYMRKMVNDGLPEQERCPNRCPSRCLKPCSGPEYCPGDSETLEIQLAAG